MKTVYVGLEGSGKSLLMGRETERIVHRNHHWLKITGIPRPIISNITYSPKFIQWAKSKGVEIKKWQHIEELEHMSECDLIIDELATYFDSRLFADLPLSTRLWLAQAQKLGVYIYGGAQDFSQVDKAFRVLCTKVYEVKKVIGSRRPCKTSPPIKRVWAFAMLWEIDPREFAGDQSEMKTVSIVPSPLWFSRKDVERFDTNSRVAMSSPPPLRKITRVCPEDGYTRVKYV